MTLHVDAAWDRPASTGNTEHWLRVDFSGLPAPGAAASIAILVDASTSMVGDRLVQARNAVTTLVRACRPEDRVAVFSFASDVQRVAEASGGDDVGDKVLAIVAGGKTRLDLALGTAATWLGPRAGLRHLVVLTDGNPTDAEGRRTPVEPLLDGALALGRTGVRAAVIGLGRADGYDSTFLRSLADACGGASFLGVPPDQLVSRALAALRSGLDDTADVTLSLESGELSLLEAWRVVPRVQPVPVRQGAVSLATANGGNVLLRCRFTSPVGATRGARSVGSLRVQGPGGSNTSLNLSINIVGPNALERNALNAEVDRMRVRVELARTASMRAATEDVEDQLRLTRRMSELVEQVADPRATMRVSSELRQLASGEALDRDAREGTVEALRGGGDDA